MKRLAKLELDPATNLDENMKRIHEKSTQRTPLPLFVFVQVRDARVAEQLVSSVQQDSVAGEAQAAAAAASRSGSDGGGAGDAQAVRLGELEMEVERLASRSEHLRAQNDVLSLTLAESRALGERMAVLLGLSYSIIKSTRVLPGSLKMFFFSCRQVRVQLHGPPSGLGTGGSGLGSLRGASRSGRE